MSAYDVWKVAGAVIASLGGGGVIVLGLSGYLGRIWAERGLEKQKQEYAQLNIAFTHQLDLASKQVQIELDKVGHLHKLRIDSEFQKLGALWKSMARLRFAFSGLPREHDDQASNKEARHQSNINASNRFFERWKEAFELWNEEALAIPKDIFGVATELLSIANDEVTLVLEHKDPFDRSSTELSDDKRLSDFLEKRKQRNEDFLSKSMKLLAMMRTYLDGNTIRATKTATATKANEAEVNRTTPDASSTSRTTC